MLFAMNFRGARILFCIFAMSWIAPACTDQASPTSDKLNLILILVDTLRTDHLGYQGYSRETSPHLDRLADESVAFFQHTGHASRTGPSVATLFTGLHPRSHGVVNPLTHWGAKGTLQATQTTLAELLSEHGYQCTGFVANSNISTRFGFGQGFENYNFLRWKNASVINEAVQGWLNERASSPAAEPPLCLYLHYVDPHSPYEAPKEISKRFTNHDYSGPITGNHKQLDRIVSGKLKIDDEDIEHLNALYDAEIRYFDERIGELIADLRRRGLLDRSLLVFVSDHGEEFLDHGSMLHGYTLYQEQLRIPLLIRHPDIQARRIDTLSRQIDVLPTILELLDIPRPNFLQGESLVPEMRGEAQEPVERPVLAHASLKAIKTVKLRSYAAGDWKIIETIVPKIGVALYNLKEDPGEKRDLAEEKPQVLKTMRAALHRFESSLPEGQGGVVKLTDEEIEELQALGYLPQEH
jgi:arylsulfatase A-like enzyme